MMKIYQLKSKLFGRDCVKKTQVRIGALFVGLGLTIHALAQTAHNPIIYADVPDMAMIRVGNTYYMSSTTMHLSPGLPIMKSKDLVNWQMVGYAYDTLASVDALNLTNGKSTYGRGSWASSLRYHNGTYYVTTFAQTTGKTYIYTTKNIEKGPWKEVSFKPSYHDHSLFFDDDGRTYLIYGAGKLKILELNADASGIKSGTTEQVLIDTPDGRWFAYLFRDFGGVGRIPYLVPVKWEDGWPVLGEKGKVPETLDLPASKGLIPGIVHSDEFTRKKGELALPLVWQWNHNPDHNLWSVTERKGYLRLKTGRIDTSFVLARNTLTQRTIGPACSGSTALDVSNLKDGDFAGLSLLQKNYGLVGVKRENGQNTIVMVSAATGRPVEVQRVPLSQKTVYLKAECDFRDRKDIANFFYSIDGTAWTKIGEPLKMPYTIPHFMGYRFGLFNYATASAVRPETGGFADFDYFRITDQLTEK